MKIDWIDKLRHFLQTVAFCLTISAIQFVFQPERPYEVPLVYSLLIGTCTWVLIDFGRHFLAPKSETGWPCGALGLLLPVIGILGGYAMGTLAADHWFGWSSWSAQGRATLPASLLITALAGVTATYYFFTRSKSSFLEAQMSEVRRQASEAKLKLLEAQLEPHMLFNTLANLRVLIGMDPDRALAMLDHIIAYLRATLSASRASSHPLQREFDRLRDYLELMTVRMGPRLHYTLDLPPELAQQSVPTLLLQPLVENSIQHGLEPKVEGGRLAISARREGNMLTLEVSDTGLGFDPATAFAYPAAPDNGFGVQQVRERLAAAYGADATIDFIAIPTGGTRATVCFPYKS